MPTSEEDFERFFRDVEPRLRRALVAALGSERGREAAAEAFVWVLENPEKLAGVRNPIPYLFKVGRSKTATRRTRPLVERAVFEEPWVEPHLARALAELPSRQRETVLLVHGAGLTLSEAAQVLEISQEAAKKRLNRGLRQLRQTIKGESCDVDKR